MFCRLAVLNALSIYDRLTGLFCHLKQESICADFLQWVLEFSGNSTWLINILMTRLAQRVEPRAPMAWNRLFTLVPPWCSSFISYFSVAYCFCFYLSVLQHTKHSQPKAFVLVLLSDLKICLADMFTAKVPSLAMRSVPLLKYNRGDPFPSPFYSLSFSLTHPNFT